MSNPFGVSGVSGGISGGGFDMFAPEAVANPNQPAWVTSFQDTLKEIHEKGFLAYAKDLNEAKLEELRKKILDKMGLSEDDLDKMSAQQRSAIEKMISEEIRERLAAQTEMKAQGAESQGAEGQGAAAQAGTNALGQSAGTDPGANPGTTPADRAAKIMAEANAPNGFGAGMTLIRAMEARTEPEPRTDI